MHERLAEPGRFVNGSRVLLSEQLSRLVAAGRVDLAQLRATDWIKLRMSGDVNKLSHLFQWPRAPGRVQKRFHWKGIRSCNFGVWRRDLEDVNGFDETFSGWGHEDADLVLRLHNRGLARKNGFCATEVYHLWHRERPRDQEDPNRQRVLSRMESGIIRAETGLDGARWAPEAVVTELNDSRKNQAA